VAQERQLGCSKSGEQVTFLIGGAAVEAPVQPDGLSLAEQDRAQIALEKCCIALWRYVRIGERLRRRELWVQRNRGHARWEERQQEMYADVWEWHHAWRAFWEATERLDGVLHRWKEEDQQAWMEQEGIMGRSVKVPESPQVLENTGWSMVRMYLGGDAPF
jgi:hypothetical protein